MTDPNSQLIAAALARLGLGQAADIRGIQQLVGGVSSDIWQIDLGGRSICAKRALPTLKVAAHWQAPLSRNAFEYAWYQTIAPAFPELVPAMLGRDPPSGIFFMQYLAPEHYPVWKTLLLQGRIDAGLAQQVGQALGQVHAFTAGQPNIAKAFESDAEFFSLRLEPYLLATAKLHPALQNKLSSLCEATANTKKCLVHGDVSPKNILCGPTSPVFLDAECAWYGDPAFDLAFCLNHLLLKAVHQPAQSAGLLAAFDSMAGAYLAQVNWEPSASLQARAAGLLPALLLARVDGKSPVEYLTNPAARQQVRDIAIPCLQASFEQLDAVRLTAQGVLKP